jgi:hypothetical protein
MVASSASVVLDYIRALHWAAIVGGTLVFVFWRYHLQIAGLIDRVSSLKLPGGEASFYQQGVAVWTEETADEVIDQRAAELVEDAVDELRTEYATQLATTQQQLSQVIERLLNQLATTELRADFESIYAHIYESQVAALRTMRATPTGSHRISLEAHLSQAKAIWAAVAWFQALTFEDWIAYPIRSALAEHGSDDLYRATPKGLGYLAYTEGLSYPARLF